MRQWPSEFRPSRAKTPPPNACTPAQGSRNATFPRYCQASDNALIPGRPAAHSRSRSQTFGQTSPAPANSPSPLLDHVYPKSSRYNPELRRTASATPAAPAPPSGQPKNAHPQPARNIHKQRTVSSSRIYPSARNRTQTKRQHPRKSRQAVATPQLFLRRTSHAGPPSETQNRHPAKSTIRSISRRYKATNRPLDPSI